MENLDKARTWQGILIMIAGVALLLHTLGLLQAGLSIVLIALSLAGIMYGLYVSGLHVNLRNLMHKK